MSKFDRPLWDHERDDQQHDELRGEAVPIKKRAKTDAQRQAESEARQRRGDRQDWTRYLRPLPKGFRLVPEATLSKQQKTARTLSIKAALAKREKRVPSTLRRRRAFSDPAREAEFYAIPKREKIEERIYYPDETRPGPYPFEVELQRLCDWFMLSWAELAPREEALVVQHGVAWDQKMRDREVASYYWTGEFPDLAEKYGTGAVVTHQQGEPA